jgi:hypothetical protein
MNELSSPSYAEADKEKAVAPDKKTAVQAAPVEPKPKRVEPASQKKAVAAPPKSSLSPELQSYLDMLKGNDAKQRRWAAKKLYKIYPYEPEVLQEVNRVLLQGYNSNLEDKNHADAMAWLCKLLANSKDNKYLATVQEVIDRTGNPKIKKHAEKAIHSFPGYSGG